jgi:hypothetical protein
MTEGMTTTRVAVCSTSCACSMISALPRKTSTIARRTLHTFSGS